MTRDLEGKTALVTGAVRGLGRGIAERLAEAGAIVALNYASNDAAALDTLASIERKGGAAFTVKAKIGAPGATERLLATMDEELTRRVGRINLDILVNNIGGGTYGSVATTTVEHYDQVFENNVRAPFFLTQALLPRLSDGGRVINISSAAPRLAGVDFVSYSMAKAALDTFTKVLAKEIGRRKITVNAVAPGFNATETNTELTDDPAARKRVEDMTLFGRFGEPADIADIVHALASPAGRWVTGQIIEASGGFALG
jgi:NAD(P)-dependent dehydrogenase (short-subunit alcohol dehydrogenase family)